MSRKITVTVSMNLVGCTRKKVIEVDDEADNDEVTEMAQEALFNMISWDWSEDETR